MKRKNLLYGIMAALNFANDRENGSRQLRPISKVIYRTYIKKEPQCFSMAKWPWGPGDCSGQELTFGQKKLKVPYRSTTSYDDLKPYTNENAYMIGKWGYVEVTDNQIKTN